MDSLLDLPGSSRRDGLVIREMEGDPVPFAVFEGVIPTRREIEIINRRRYGLHLVSIPRSWRDLRFLAAFEDRLEHLGIADFDVEDVSPIAAMSNLESLSLHVNQREGLDVSGLVRLRSYDGALRHFEGVLDLPAIERLSLQSVREGTLDRIPSSLVSLSLVDAHSVNQLPKPPAPPALEELYIAGASQLDLASLELYPRLATVGLIETQQVTSVDTLLKLHRLKAVAFDRCASIEPQSRLLQLANVTINVLGRNPFGRGFRAQLDQTDSTWTFYGTARRTSSE